MKFKQKKLIIPLVVLLVFVAIRIAMPPVILKFANNYLETFSPIITGHIDDIDLAIIRGAYRAEGVMVKLKRMDHTLLTVATTEISIAWRELLKGKVLADIETDSAKVFVSKAALEELKKFSRKDAEEAKEMAIPLEIERMVVKNSQVTLLDFEGFKKGEKLKLEEINTRMTNLTPKEGFPFSFFTLSAKVQGSAPVKVAGKLNLLAKPIEWDVDGTMEKFQLPMANQFLRKKVPLTFVHGSADVYAEAKSEGGIIDGYVKPFLNELNVIKTDENFKGTKHWAFEVVTAISNIMLKNTKENSMATRIPFRFGKGVEIDTGEAIQKTLQHGYESKLKPGIENKFDIQ
jgi:hypothetical protein